MRELSTKIILKSTKKQHAQIHQHPFLLFKGSSNSLLPYYLVNQQLYHIYNALDLRFKEIDKSYFMSLRQAQFNDILFERANARWDDIEYMHSKGVGAFDTIEPNTKKFILQIQKATPHQWLGYFLVRILADINGGQFVRANLSQLYKQHFMLGGLIKMLEGIKIALEQKDYSIMPNLINHCNNCCLSQKGTRAYQFPHNTKQQLEETLPSLTSNDEQTEATLSAAKEAFTFMSGIYDDLYKKVSSEDECSSVKLKSV